MTPNSWQAERSKEKARLEKAYPGAVSPLGEEKAEDPEGP